MNEQKFIYFYSHSKGPYKSFSQWYHHQFSVPKQVIKELTNFDIESDLLVLKSAEHWMMIMKALLFNDITSYKRLIHPRTDVKEAKEIGRGVKEFNEKEWDKWKLTFVSIGNIYKFSGPLSNLLQSTNNSVLVEASPYDKIWGIGISVEDAEKGKKWNGQNLLGKALMVAREYLKINKQRDFDSQLFNQVQYFVLTGKKKEEKENKKNMSLEEIINSGNQNR
jgi:ribA/ribD-fused uncharacterized protein